MIGFTGFSSVFPMIFRFYWVYQGFIGFTGFLPSFNLVFTCFLPSFTGFDLFFFLKDFSISLGFTEFEASLYLVFT